MFLAGIADYPKTLAKVIHPVFCNLCWKMFTYSLTRMMGQFDLLCNLALYPTHPRVLSCGVFWTHPYPPPSLCCVQIASVLGPRMTIRVIIPLQYCPWLSICTALRLNQGEVRWRREDQRDLRTLDTRVRVRQACVETREGSIRIMNFQITVLEAFKVFFMESSTIQTAWQNCLGNGIFSFPATIRWIWHFPGRFFGK